MSLTPYPTLRLKLTMPQALKMQFLPAVPGFNATNTAAALANKVNRTGDTMTGFLTLSGAPTDPFHAATKAYVDGSTIGGPFLPVSNPNALGAFTVSVVGGNTISLVPGGATSNSVQIAASGADAAVNLDLRAKGNASVEMFTNGALQALATGPAGTDHYIQLTGSAGGNPQIGAGGGGNVEIASLVMTGNPTAPTPAVGDADTSVATTAFVAAATREKITANRTYFVRTPAANVAISIASPGVVSWNAHGLSADAPVVFAILPQEAACTITIASPAVVTRVAHGFAAGQPIKFASTGALPTGITAGTTYFVIAAGLAADTFQFAATVGGAAINTSGTQSGIHLNSVTGTMPTGLVEGTTYFARATGMTANSFQVAATAGGAAINTTGTTSGQISGTTGNDNNDGRTNTPAGAVLTIQKAIDLVAALDLGNGPNAIITVASSLYTGGMVLKTTTGAGTVFINGNTTAPTNCILSVTGTFPIRAAQVRGPYTINGFHVRSNTGGFHCLSVSQQSMVGLANIRFEGAAGHISTTFGAQVQINPKISTVGAFNFHYYADTQAMVNEAGHTGANTILVIGSPAILQGWAYSIQGATTIANGNSYSHAATGPRSYTDGLAYCYTGTSGSATYFPGDGANATASGGIYN